MEPTYETTVCRKKERARERNMRALDVNLLPQLVSPDNIFVLVVSFWWWCFVSVTFCQLPLLTSVFWIGLGGSLERPSHSIDLAEMRRYCIMYYQQSYVLILSHEMALFPFTYYLNFNYCQWDSLIISCDWFQGFKVLSYIHCLDCECIEGQVFFTQLLPIHQ